MERTRRQRIGQLIGLGMESGAPASYDRSIDSKSSSLGAARDRTADVLGDHCRAVQRLQHAVGHLPVDRMILDNEGSAQRIAAGNCGVDSVRSGRATRPDTRAILRETSARANGTAPKG